MDPLSAARRIKAMALELGFDRVGICSADPIGRGDYVRSWVAAGRAGEMGYLRRNLDVRLAPRQLLEGARSVIVVALNYHQPAPPAAAGGQAAARIASYAWGEDYHRVVKRKLQRLIERMRGELDTPFEARACVDTAPLVERELAARGGLGWIGKNTLVLDAGLGSYFFLGELVTTLALPSDAPVADHCGTCTRCLDACPTRAFPAAYQMDATRCISYLTIEHRSDIADELRPLMGEWLFGCDICQEVCPFNQRAPRTQVAEFSARPPAPRVDPHAIVGWTPRDYADTLRGSALKRAKLPMLKRNAMIAAENLGVSPPAAGG